MFELRPAGSHYQQALHNARMRAGATAGQCLNLQREAAVGCQVACSGGSRAKVARR